MGEPAEMQWVTVTSSLPVHPYSPLSERPPITTTRLLLRPLTPNDLKALHVLRCQPEVAAWSSKGTPNASEDVTLEELNQGLEPDVYQWAICLLATGELIGIGGSHRRVGNLGWPVIGYAIRHETWGNGYGTEFLQAFLTQWWSLPRAQVEVQVEESTVVGAGDDTAECIVATTTNKNVASQKVMTKNGMELAKVWREPDRSRPGEQVVMYGYVARKPC